MHKPVMRRERRRKGERNEKKNDGSSINNGNDSRCAWWMWKQHGK